MKGKILAIRPLPKGFERQPPPSLEVLRQQAEIRALKAQRTAARSLRIAR
jgi:hypothetical protein